MDPVPDPLLLRKSGSAGNRTRDLCICSQKHCGATSFRKVSKLFFWLQQYLPHYIKLEALVIWSRDGRLKGRVSTSAGGKLFSVLTHVQIASAATRPDIDWVMLALSPEVKAAGS